MLTLHIADKDTSYTPQQLGLPAIFPDKFIAEKTIANVPITLQAKGFVLASIDSLSINDSSAYLLLFVGKKFNWLQLKPVGISDPILASVGFSEKAFNGTSLNFEQYAILREKLLQYYENNGYPFAKIFLDSISLNENSVSALLKADAIYKNLIDSIRVIGKANINNRFLQHYLNIPAGSEYSVSKLAEVDKRIAELPYIIQTKPSELELTGGSSVLNLYLDNKKNSQINFLVGLMPQAGITNKFQLTYDVNLDLKNMFGNGEGFILKAQQLQIKSPVFQLGYDHPYILNSNFGVNTFFSLFKKDSSFIQVNAHAGLQYIFSQRQVIKAFFQYQSNSLLPGAVDTFYIKQTKMLPENVDVKSLNIGLQYEFNNTDYKFNPRRGNEVQVVSISGIKTISKSDDVLAIKDASFNYASLYDTIKSKSYQLKLKMSGAKYFPVRKSSVFKASLSSGFYESPSVFRNELFQIGGYKLLRGFDEESVYANIYGVASVEYRQLISTNSYLFGFVDGAITKTKYQLVNTTNNFISTGLGIFYETKAGLLNLSVAVGKRNDINFSLRQAAKIHFGYINYF